MESKTHICAECAMPFEPVRADAVFCSQACQKRARRKAKLTPIYPAKPPTIPRHADLDDVAAAIVSARTDANTFSQLSKVAPYPLRAGCERIAYKIETAIKEEGW